MVCVVVSTFDQIKPTKINLSLFGRFERGAGMDKAELRRAIIARRDALDLDMRAAKSAAVCARLVELLGGSDPVAPRTVAVCAAMGSEADPAAFAAADLLPFAAFPDTQRPAPVYLPHSIHASSLPYAQPASASYWKHNI